MLYKNRSSSVILGLTWLCRVPLIRAVNPKLLLILLGALVLFACGGGGDGGGGNNNPMPATTYNVNVNVTGLSGAGLILQNNGGDDLSILSNGNFSFSIQLEDNSAYAITVLSQPFDQQCSVRNGRGLVAAADVNNISVACRTLYSLGGNISGLSNLLERVILENNKVLAIGSRNGRFTFTQQFVDGSNYDVQVRSQPLNKECTVKNGDGQFRGGDINDVAVSCVASTTYTIGGTVSGLSGTVTLTLNQSTDLPLSENTPYAFDINLLNNSAYDVAISQQPSGQLCSVANESGVIQSANVNNIDVTCQDLYSVGGTVNDLISGTLVLRNNSEFLELTQSGPFSFVQQNVTNALYDVIVHQHPQDMQCAVSNGNGNISNANVTDIVVNCQQGPFYTVGGSITGLLQGEQLSFGSPGHPAQYIVGNEQFVLVGGFLRDEQYDVSISQNIQSAGRNCIVQNGSGVVQDANITNIQVRCAQNFDVGGAINGLQAGENITLRDAYTNIEINPVISGINSQFVFPQSVFISGMNYNIDVSQQPSGRLCEVSNGSGLVGAVDVTDITVTCRSISGFTLGGRVSGMGQGLLGLALNSTGNAVEQISVTEDGNYTFSTELDAQDDYQVTIFSYPTGLSCRVDNADGRIDQAGGNIFDVNVTCFGVPVSPRPNSILIVPYVKGIRFDWNDRDMDSATEFFRVHKSMTGTGGTYEQISADIPLGTGSFTDPISVHLHDWDATSYIIEACNTVGCSASEAIVPGFADALNAIGIVNPGADKSIAISANARSFAIAHESIEIYEKSESGQWVLESSVTGTNTESSDQFGGALAFSGDGNTLAVGARHEDSADTGINGNEEDNSFSNAGAVYVFIRTDSGWQQQAYVKASNSDRADQFGADVALSYDGSVMAVGAPTEDSAAEGVNGLQIDDCGTPSPTNCAAGTGAVYVFNRNAAQWSQVAYVKPTNTTTGYRNGINELSRFGGDVSLDNAGQTLAVGAVGEDTASRGVGGSQDITDNLAVSSGAVYVYANNGVDWEPQAYIKSSNSDSRDRFGKSIGLSGDGNTLVASAHFEDSDDNNVNGDQTSNTAEDAGAVYVFARTGIQWNQTSYLKAPNSDAGDNFGRTIRISNDGSVIAIAASGEDSLWWNFNNPIADENGLENSGAVYLFQQVGTAYVPRKFVKAPNDRLLVDYHFKMPLALDGTGETLLIGAIGTIYLY